MNISFSAKTVMCFGFPFVGILWLIFALTTDVPKVGDHPTWGQWGDKFGALNCLFGGFGIVGLVATLTHQREEAAKKEKESSDLMARLERTAAALEHQTKMSEQAQYVQLLAAVLENAETKITRAMSQAKGNTQLAYIIAQDAYAVRENAADEIDAAIDRLRSAIKFRKESDAPSSST